MRIAVQRLPNLQCQVVHATAHVRRSHGQPNPHTGGLRDHPRSTVTTRRSVTRLISCPTLIEVPSGSVISILLSATAISGPLTTGGSERFRRSADDGSLISCTGTKTACGSGLRTPRRTRLRQFHSSPRLISYRRAISAMLAPGCSVSATIRSFAAPLQGRRRSTPVMISIRLTVPDLSGARTSAV